MPSIFNFRIARANPSSQQKRSQLSFRIVQGMDWVAFTAALVCSVPRKSNAAQNLMQYSGEEGNLLASLTDKIRASDEISEITTLASGSNASLAVA